MEVITPYSELLVQLSKHFHCCFGCLKLVLSFKYLFSRPTPRLLVYIQGQTCHGCINHEIIIGLCKSCLLVYPVTYIEHIENKFQPSRESNPGPLDHELFALTDRPVFYCIFLLKMLITILCSYF